MTQPANQAKDFSSMFNRHFQSLTGNPSLLWQERLFSDHFVKNDIPAVIDIPTGLGKTMVMAIWLIARAVNNKLPRRLIYVVDRRTVVDQATDVANQLRKTVDENPEFKQLLQLGDQSLPISTLRGQLADNREWSRDPSMPAIIIGTVDLIGSALLFSGYRSSYKRRPLEAGLLGQDSLLVLDEAHLSKPFEKLICDIGEEGSFQKSRDGNSHGKPMRSIRMSATSGQSDGSKPGFALQIGEAGDLTGEDATDAIVIERYRAKKRLVVKSLGEKDKVDHKLADAAIELAEDPDLIGKRIVVFVRSPDDAKKIADKIRSHAKPSNSRSNPDPKGPYADSVEVLTGTMRGLERDELVDDDNAVFKSRWLNGNLKSDDPTNQQPVFLISTSAGEVGFDLNADHLVGDAAPFDSWIQRLGRVNRRGYGEATVILIKTKKPAEKSAFDTACIATSNLLTDGMDVSPRALVMLKKSLSPEQLNEALSPEPAMVELTDILLDAWSMTSITARLPGRPEVAPWLRGIADNLPRTTIAWRAELDLLKDVPNPNNAFKAIFAKHSIRPHETLTTNSYRVVNFLKEVTAQKKGRHELRKTRVVIKFSRDLDVTTIGQLIDNPGPLNADPTLILPASFGGLDNAGMLSPEAVELVQKPADSPPRSLDVADHPGYERKKDDRARLRVVIKRSDNEWMPVQLTDGLAIPADLKLQPPYKSSTLLFDAIRKANLRIRLVQPFAFDSEEGDTERSLVMLAPAPKSKKKEEQPLTEHVAAVKDKAEQIAYALELNDPIQSALIFAAKWHDEGKKANIWQRFVMGPNSDGELLGKAARTRDPKSLKGYRHEFGSLLRIHYPQPDIQCKLPSASDIRDLALHLIATHHGSSRPHFGNPFDREFKTEQSGAIHLESIRRFARLQRKYGWWYLAWLENLLRCADALASADQESEDDPVGSTDEDGGTT